MSSNTLDRLRPRPNRGRLVYTVQEVADMLGLGLGGTYTLSRESTIPALKMGGRWVVPKNPFHAWLDGVDGQADDVEPEAPPECPVRRTLFRARVWRPSLVRAGLLGHVLKRGHFAYRATWTDATGLAWSKDFATERKAVAHIARTAPGGLRFHDLRHSYATWLISQGVPVNDVVSAMGHEKANHQP
jgi:excisionase family DNA binding protein